jgi:pimeloyl-ACP methyl ester carboxylesterase
VPSDLLLTGRWAASFVEACAADDELQATATRSRFAFGWSVGGRRVLVACAEGAVTVAGADGGTTAADPPGAVPTVPAFSLAGPAGVWADWLRPVPPAGRHDVMAMIVTGGIQLDGDPAAFGQHLRVTRRLLELARTCCLSLAGAAPGSASDDTLDDAGPGVEDVVGGYTSLDVGGRRMQVFFEGAGAGVPVLLLHTAGSDARQYRFMLADRDYRSFRLVAFDLPFHGRSLPPPGWWREPYRLSTAFYAEVVEAFIDRLCLDRPVLVGASMAAQIILELAMRRPGGYRSVAAFGAVDAVGGTPAGCLHQPEVNEAEVVPSWVAGLASPTASEARRHELWWCYSQSGAGVFAGDAAFFMEEWDAAARLPSLDTAACPVHLFAGEYDYSRPPARVRATADLIPGATFTELPGSGHFPMVEAPDQVKAHLLPILAAVR